MFLKVHFIFHISGAAQESLGLQNYRYTLVEEPLCPGFFSKWGTGALSSTLNWDHYHHFVFEDRSQNGQVMETLTTAVTWNHDKVFSENIRCDGKRASNNGYKLQGKKNSLFNYCDFSWGALARCGLLCVWWCVSMSCRLSMPGPASPVLAIGEMN